MVPEGWQLIPLGEISDVKGGKRLPKGRSLTRQPTNFPYIRVKDMRDGTICTDDIHFVPDDLAPEISRYIISKDDLFITVAGTLGMVGEVPSELDGANLTENADKITNIRASKRFILEVLRSSRIQNQIDQVKTTSAQPKLALERIRSFLIPLPPRTEQDRIASILTTWQKAITSTESLLTNAEMQKTALMQQLLTGKKRLPGFSGEWKLHKLGELFKERSEIGHNDLPLLSITTKEGVIPRDDVSRKDTSNADKSKYRRICPGDIGYNTMRMWQGVSALSDYEGIVSPAYTILKPEPSIHPRFAAYLFKHPQLIHEFYRHSQGLVSDTWNLKYPNFARIEWHFPNIDEQKAIAGVLETTDAVIDLLNRDISRLTKEKKALMQQLLTGKRRVKVN